MKKKEQGILTVEASIVLTLFLLFVLFLFSFARMYRAQNMISHATMQSADALALESYIREVAHDEDANEIVKLGNQLSGLTSLSEESFTSLRAADIPKLAKEKFAVAISSSDANADAILKKLGVKGGLSGVDFSVSKMDLNTNDVIVYANYTLELQFPVFGFSEINVTKAARAKTFGDILFEICTISNDEAMGTASGGGSYKHGTTIEITAEPKYGYYFEGWDDDGDGDVDYDGGKAVTASKRTVTVTDAKTYTAIFKNNGYGVNASICVDGVEDTKGIGTITMVPMPDPETGKHSFNQKVDITVALSENLKNHYNWHGWTGQLRQDKDGDGIEETILSIPEPKNNFKYTISQVKGNYHLIANFTPKQYEVNVSVKDGVGGSAVIVGTNKPSTNVTYPGSVSLTAKPAVGYAVDYWIKNGSKIQSSDGQVTISNEQITDDTNYTVVFKKIIRTVRFFGPDNKVINNLTLTVVDGQSLSEAGYSLPMPTAINNMAFVRWKDFTANTEVYERDIDVYGEWITPSVTLSVGGVGHHSITVTATTVPSNAKVSWSQNGGEKVSIKENSSNNHEITVTLNDSKFNVKQFDVSESSSKYIDDIYTQVLEVYTDITIYASLTDYNVTPANKTITIKPSVQVRYIKYNDGGYRRYYSTTQDYEALGYSSTNSFDRTWNVTYSEYKSADKYDYNEYYPGNAEDIKKGIGQGGKNLAYKIQDGKKKGIKGYALRYPKKLGSWGAEVLAYHVKTYGDKKDKNSYYDYYISAVK